MVTSISMNVSLSGCQVDVVSRCWPLIKWLQPMAHQKLHKAIMDNTCLFPVKLVGWVDTGLAGASSALNGLFLSEIDTSD